MKNKKLLSIFLSVGASIAIVTPLVSCGSKSLWSYTYNIKHKTFAPDYKPYDGGDIDKTTAETKYFNQLYSNKKMFCQEVTYGYGLNDENKPIFEEDYSKFTFLMLDINKSNHNLISCKMELVHQKRDEISDKITFEEFKIEFHNIKFIIDESITAETTKIQCLPDIQYFYDSKNQWSIQGSSEEVGDFGAKQGDPVQNIDKAVNQLQKYFKFTSYYWKDVTFKPEPE